MVNPKERLADGAKGMQLMKPSTQKPLISRPNPLIKDVSNRLYSNKDKTGDVTFASGRETVVAHKSVLATLSPKYEAQFYGIGSSNCDVVEITEPVAAFHEFLQFFYLAEVVLTSENIEHVLSLAKDALVDEIINECFRFLSETVSVDSLCQTYHLALTYGSDGLVEFCERQIGRHSGEILASEGFLSSNRDIVLSILQMDSLNCKETVVFNACIEWANHPDQPTAQLRDVLGSLLYQIRFGTMSFEEFISCYKAHKDLFTDAERDEILFTIGNLAEFSARLFNDEPRGAPYRKWDEKTAVECNRVLTEVNTGTFHFGNYSTEFSCSSAVLLGGFYCVCLVGMAGCPIAEKYVTAHISIARKKTAREADGRSVYEATEQLTFQTDAHVFVKIPRPIHINPALVYAIQVEIKEGFSANTYKFKNEVTLSDGTTVNFYGTQGLVTGVLLNHCQEPGMIASNQDDETNI